MKSFKITENDAEQRLDKFIQKVAGNLSPSLMYKYLRKKAVKVNGKRALGNTRLKVGDLVELYINDEFFTKKNTDFRAIAYQPKLNVVYEDANLLLVDKKPGVPVHADDHAGRDTLINQVLLYLYQKGDYDPEAEHSFTPALCNRLDQNTGGLVMIAKNAAAGRALYEIVKYRQVEKRYLALALGRFSEKQATLRAYLRKDSRNNRVDICDRPREGYKEIITRYRVLRESERLSLLEIELVTGRTHQIRVHLASIGHPVAGDAVYGPRKVITQLEGQCLHAKTLGFIHPATGAYVEFDSPLPEYFTAFIGRLQKEM